MPFSQLLFESLEPGKTTARDPTRGCHTAAELKPVSNETVLLFHIDDERTRKRLGLTDGKCCDKLYFVKNNDRCLLIFVELKSSDRASAVEQILGAFHAIRGRCEFVKSAPTAVIGVIVTTQSAPGKWKQMQKNARSNGIEIRAATTHKEQTCDLRDIVKDRSR